MGIIDIFISMASIAYVSFLRLYSDIIIFHVVAGIMRRLHKLAALVLKFRHHRWVIDDIFMIVCPYIVCRSS